MIFFADTQPDDELLDDDAAELDDAVLDELDDAAPLDAPLEESADDDDADDADEAPEGFGEISEDDVASGDEENLEAADEDGDDMDYDSFDDVDEL